ncbi:MAG: hypothetical protein ACTSW7_01895 [Candidatus Thorarchaeota archaeon]
MYRRSLYPKNEITQKCENISNDDARELANKILQVTGHIERSELIDSITRILRKK